MNERWQRVKDLFGRALELSEKERTAFLETECGEDLETLREVTNLIESSGATDDFLENSPGLDLLEAEEELPRMLGDDFELLRVLGQGGMGVVYYARQLSLERHVAVKVQSRAAMLTRTQVERFHREARAAAKLNHPNIAPLYSVERVEDLHFYAMEYIPGHDLATELKLQRGNGVDPVLDEQAGDERAAENQVEPAHAFLPDHKSSRYIAAVVTVCRQIADAIQAAHTGGVVHRDIKPNNILLDPRRKPYLVDFGLAKLESADGATLTSEQAGSPHYMSPEQVNSDAEGVDFRTDIYSLGVVLYEQLAFRRPFEAKNTLDIFDLIRSRDPVPLRKANNRVPRDLETICHKAMAREPAARYLSAGDFALDLGRFLDHEAILARPPGYAERAWRQFSRHRFLIGAATILPAGLFGSSRLGVVMERKEKLAGHVARLLASDALPAPTIDDLVTARSALADVTGLELSRRGERARASLESKIRERVERLRTEGRDGISLQGTGASTGGESSFLESWEKVRAALRLAPDDGELKRLASGATLLPRLTLRGDCGNASVYLRQVHPGDGLLGPKLNYGSFPLEDAIVPPGYYRIFVVSEAGRSGEYARHFSRPGYSLVIDIELRPTEEVTHGMQLIPAGSFLFGGDSPDADGPARDRSLELDAFYCDEAEVSVAEYAAFVDETGCKEPLDWRELQELVPPDNPATGMTWEEARAYAEWAGKRLLTHAEWERAARGTQGRSFPWGNDPRLDEALGNIEKEEPDVPEGSNMRLEFALMMAPVRSHPEAATSEGLFHMFGNVKEYTETIAAIQGSTRSDEFLHGEMRILKSGDMTIKRDDPSRGEGLRYVVSSPFHAFGLTYGFRCGKSARP